MKCKACKRIRATCDDCAISEGARIRYKTDDGLTRSGRVCRIISRDRAGRPQEIMISAGNFNEYIERDMIVSAW